MQNENKQSIKEQNKKSAAGLNLQRSNYNKGESLVVQLGLDELAVQAGDVGD